MYPKKKNFFYNASLEKSRNIIGHKLSEARSAAGFTLSELAQRLEQYGISTSRSAISKWENGNTYPDPYQLMALIHALNLSDQPFDFFSSGTEGLNETGLKKLMSYRADLLATGLYSSSKDIPEQTFGMRLLPFYDLPVSAGRGSILYGDDFSEKEFPEDIIPGKTDFALRISGDSMTPYYRPNEVVWVQSTNYIYPGEVGIFIYDGEGYIKEYCESSTGIDQETYPIPTLKSYNPKYAPIVIEAEHPFQVVGRVLGTCPVNWVP